MFRSLVVASALTAALIPGAAAQAAPRDAAYLRVAHQTNLAEIAGNRIALRKSPDPDIRAVAVRFIQDHMAMDAEVIRVAALLQVRLPDLPSAEQQALGNRYEATPASLFDPLYVSTQMAGHAKALAGARQEADHGDDVQVRQVAAAAVPVIAAHHHALDTVGYGRP
ncbi:DUF4142 domain-containing protein [Actinoplanes sp. LDG1-06]|uniref:DUF4142 domain-containing protein n=1 Tax=Paractinoplanes ovalisporus TaxID=2810368 RepID=A0ABS2A8V3_9ACTN|nr:DUF4142 domain-containing protein [Actinoplanes ovalisporus]MBM2616257.1 DUF4142 domain-containing protein [Actinoplanes ovalisporus]